MSAATHRYLEPPFDLLIPPLCLATKDVGGGCSSNGFASRMSAHGSDLPLAIQGAPTAASAAGDLAARRKRRIESFHPAWQKSVASLTADDPALEDLADTFPALLFALVSGYGTAQARASALTLVSSGAALKHASDSLALPFWLRRLPAGAFQQALQPLPMDNDFSLRIASFIPRRGSDAAAWLTALSGAATAAGGDFALWFARAIRPAFLSEESLLMMGAWAWFSCNPDTEGSKLIRKGWTPEISARRALDEFNVWRRRLRLVDALGFGTADCWLEPGLVAGLTFVPLRTVSDFLEESVRMENCLDQYADQLSAGRNVVFSIRRRERHLACVEIGVHDEECTMPSVVQLRGPRNRRVSPEIWRATFAWLGSQELVPRKLRSPRTQSAQRSRARQQLWQPYLEHISGSPLEVRLRDLLLLPARSTPRGGKRPAGSSGRRDREVADEIAPSTPKTLGL